MNHIFVHRLSFFSGIIGLLLAACCIASIGGCGDEPMLYIALTDYPKDAEKLEMSLILGDQTVRLNDVEGLHTRFILPFPDAPDGRAHLTVSAVNHQGCKVASGDLVADMPGGVSSFSEHTVPLMMHATPICPVKEGLREIPMDIPGDILTRKGLTWGKILHDNTRGHDAVSCHASGVSCNPYDGDTACSEERRILCLYVDGSGSNGFVSSFYDGWTAGHIALSKPVKGSSLTSLAVADGICAEDYGPGWRMAEHHDGGGGWGWRAYGNLRAGERFWMYVNDQPDGNCFPLPSSDRSVRF